MSLSVLKDFQQQPRYVKLAVNINNATLHFTIDIVRPWLGVQQVHRRFLWIFTRTCDYVTFWSLLLQICLSSVTFVRPTHGFKLTAIFLRHLAIL